MTDGTMTQPSQIVHPFRLLENSPFNSQTTIRYSLPAEGKILLQIYNITGRLVKTLANANMKPGVYSVIWNGDDEQGNKVASGVYFYAIKSDGQSIQKKMLMLR
jgi:flagellar hook assembly protein FlgD